MKKLLALFVVLALVNVANAGLIFTVNGVPQDAEITIAPSQTIEIDLEVDPESIGVKGYVIDYTLDSALAEFIYTDISFPAVLDFPGVLSTGDPQFAEITGAQMTSPPYHGTDPLMQGLILHCLGQGDVLLQVIALEGTIIDGEPIDDGTVLHSLIIHQYIPEPMTLTLLGLGGLFLARRKK